MSLFVHELAPGGSVRIPLSDFDPHLAEGFSLQTVTISSSDVSYVLDAGDVVLTVAANADLSAEEVTLRFSDGVNVDKTVDVPKNTTDYGIGGIAPASFTLDTVGWQSGSAEVVGAQYLHYTPIVDFIGDTNLFVDSIGADPAVKYNATILVSVVDPAPVVASDLTAFVRKNTRTQLSLDNDELGNGRTLASASVPPEFGTVEVVNGELFFTPALDVISSNVPITYTLDDGN